MQILAAKGDEDRQFDLRSVETGDRHLRLSQELSRSPGNVLAKWGSEARMVNYSHILFIPLPTRHRCTSSLASLSVKKSPDHPLVAQYYHEPRLTCVPAANCANGIFIRV